MGWLLLCITVARRPARTEGTHTPDLRAIFGRGDAVTNSEEMYEFRLEGRTLCCIFAGRLGSNECPQIEDELDKRLAAPPQSAVFDLKKADFVSSAFLRVCIRTARRLEGGRLSIINASPLIKEVLMAAGFDRVPEISVQ